MQPENWKEIKKVLQEVLGLDPDRRKRFLENAAISPGVRREVESLLELEDEANRMMDLSAVAFSKNFFDDEENVPDAMKDQEVGVYRILRELGTGGMGAVYLAERTDGQFDQLVAVKMLRREFNTREIRRRFDHEKEIQAALNHPNIARLIDAGSTMDSVPYLVMEHIEGEPISRFCRRRELTLEQRLKLFNKVCEAVAFAHRNLVIHRDLKPSNILVTEDGEPKLLDFGISKLLSGRGNEQTRTVTRLGVMTPEYASPEQVKGESVTTATDIYSLGVILFELLTGHRPFEKEFREKGNILKAILENEPEKPSDVLAEARSDGALAAAATEQPKTKDAPVDEAETLVMEERKTLELVRQTRAQFAPTNPKQLRGDLDNVILKALRKEPERRYRTVEQFASDIWNHLDGLPVSARPATFSYRTAKFIRRNKFGVAAGCLILLAILIGLIATLWQARVARAERIKAEKRFEDVRNLANSFLFEITPEIEKLSGSTRVKELVVKRALEYLKNLSDEAAGDARLQSELANAYEKVGGVQGNPYQNNIGDIEGAKASYEKARILLEALLKNDPENPDLKRDLARVLGSVGDVNFYGDDTEKATASYQQARQLWESVVSARPDDADARLHLGMTISELGLIEFWAGRNKKALETYDLSRKIFEKLHAEDPNDVEAAHQTANIYIRIGEVLGWEEKAEQGAELLEKGLEMAETLAESNPGDKKIRRTLLMANMRRAENHVDQKQFGKGLEFYRKAEKMAAEALEKDPESARAKRDLIIMKFKVAETLDLAGHSRESLESLKQVLGLQEQLAESDPKNAEHRYDIGTTRIAIGDAYYNLKNYDQALETFQTAIKNFSDLVAADPENNKSRRGEAVAKQNLGKTCVSLGDLRNRPDLYKTALANFRQSLEILTKLKEENSLDELDNELIEALEKQIAEARNKIR
ncbi:MAG: protein kinase [Pyrinomonadaceae bacterium]